MKKSNLLKAIYYFEKSKIASNNGNSGYLKISHFKIVNVTLDRNGFINTVSYYNSFIYGDYPKTPYYNELKFTSDGIEYYLRDNLHEVINSR